MIVKDKDKVKSSLEYSAKPRSLHDTAVCRSEEEGRGEERREE